MRKRLAKKIKDHKDRYSIGQLWRALVRLGWKQHRWKMCVSIIPKQFDVVFGEQFLGTTNQIVIEEDE